MQKFAQLSLVGVICLFIGQLGARYQCERERRNNQESIGGMLETHAYNDVGPTISILEHLRAGNTNSAIASLESKLYTDVYDIWYFYKKHQGHILDAHRLELLDNVRAYKRKYPWDTRSPSIDQLVAEILSVTKAPTSK